MVQGAKGPVSRIGAYSLRALRFRAQQVRRARCPAARRAEPRRRPAWCSYEARRPRVLPPPRGTHAAASACAAEMGLDEDAELIDAIMQNDVDRVKAALASGANVFFTVPEEPARRA